MADADDMKIVVLVYSDDRNTRADVVDAFGPTLGGFELEIREVATAAAVLAELDQEDIDCCVFDAEATPVGGMGLSKQIRDEYNPCPPVVLLIARQVDSWLATWSRAEAIHQYPIDPFALAKQVEDLVFIEVDDEPTSYEVYVPSAIEAENVVVTDVDVAVV